MKLASGFTNDQLILAPVTKAKAPRPAERPRACPQCGRSSLKRRARLTWERVLCAVTTPAFKIRPYQCTQCHHRNWELVRWAQPLDLLRNPAVMGASAVAGLIVACLVVWTQPDWVLPQNASASSMKLREPVEIPIRLTDLVEPTAPARSASKVLPATVLESATLHTLGGRRALLLRDNGTLREYNTWMQQSSRERFVIDLPGAWTLGTAVPGSMNLKGTHADRINISAYPEHLRVSIRMRPGAEGLPQVVETSSGLNILLD